MTIKINSREYREKRFRSLDWRIKGGEKQSFIHAKNIYGLLTYLNISMAPFVTSVVPREMHLSYIKNFSPKQN